MAVKMVKEEIVRALVAAGVFQVAPSASTLKLMKREQLQAMLDEHDAKTADATPDEGTVEQRAARDLAVLEQMALKNAPSDADLAAIEASPEKIEVGFAEVAALSIVAAAETPAERLARLKALAPTVRGVPFATKGRTNLERKIRKLERKLAQPSA